VFDIKIYDGNGNEWQPIDEGKTVTLSFPVAYDEVGLIHVIDYVGAIEGRTDLTFLPVAEIAEASLRSLLGPAMDAYEAVYGNRDYVAVEEMAAVTAVDGMASFEVNSFSLYIPFDGHDQLVSDDWESYHGYKKIADANAAIQDGTAKIYKFKKGDTLRILYGKSRSTDFSKYYRIYSGDGINDSPSQDQTYVSGKVTGQSWFLANYDYIDFTADTDGKENKYRSFIACIANGSVYGGGIPICPVADPTDNKLNFVAVSSMAKLKIIGAFLKLKRGKILSLKQTVTQPIESIKILSNKPLTVNVDGELYENIPLEVSIVSNTLKMYR
jgi:hypothetical protein